LAGSSLSDHLSKGHETEYRRRFGAADITVDCIALPVCDTCLPKLLLDYNFFLSDKAVRQKACPFYAQERSVRAFAGDILATHDDKGWCSGFKRFSTKI
jgi:hypothetical protein